MRPAPRVVLAALATFAAAAMAVSAACDGSPEPPAKPSTPATLTAAAPPTILTPPTRTPSTVATPQAGTATPDAFAGCTLLDKPESTSSKDVAQLVACAQGNPSAPKVIAIHHWVARNPNTPSEWLRRLAAAAEYPSVRCGVAGNPSSPEDVIVGLNPAFPSCTAANPSAPLELLCATAASADPKPFADDPVSLARLNIQARKGGAWQSSCPR